MRRLALVAMGIIMALAMTGVAVAANPHYVSGPDFDLAGNTVTATGSVAGLGNQNIDVKLLVAASQEVQCRNHGGNIAPGQTKHFTAETTQSNLEVKNGRVNFTISATADPAGLDLSGACNRNWTPEPGAVTVHSATLNIYQPTGSGNLVLSNSTTF
jgi:hypothetical protein